MQRTETEGPYIGGRPLREILAGTPTVDKAAVVRLALCRALDALSEAYGDLGEANTGIRVTLEGMLAMMLDAEREAGVEHAMREHLLRRLLSDPKELARI